MIQKGSDASFDVDRLALVDMHLLDGHDVEIDLDGSDRASHAGHTSLHQGTGTGRGGGRTGHFVSPVGMPLKDQHRQWHVVSPPTSSQTSQRAPAAAAGVAARSGSLTKKGSGPGGAGRRPDDSLLHEVEAAVAFVNALVPSPAPAAVPAGH